MIRCSCMDEVAFSGFICDFAADVWAWNGAASDLQLQPLLQLLERFAAM